MQAPRADIFRFLVHSGGETRDFLNRIIGERQLDAFCLEQRDVLLDQSILRLGQNSNEILNGQRIEFNANRKPALKFRNQIRRLATWNAPAAMNRM